MKDSEKICLFSGIKNDQSSLRSGGHVLEFWNNEGEQAFLIHLPPRPRARFFEQQWPDIPTFRP